MVKYRRRLLVYVAMILLIGSFLAFSCFSTWKQIYANKKTKQELSEKYNNLSVISIVTDPENLFDYEKGIYVLGKTAGSPVISCLK